MDKKKISDLFLRVLLFERNLTKQKIAELELRHQSSGWLHVVCITETWFTYESVSTTFGYKLYCCDMTKSMGKLGGLGINVRESISIDW